jgi:hypothetical protein
VWIAFAPMPNGLEMSRPASSSNQHYTRFAAAGRVGSIELLGGDENGSGRGHGRASHAMMAMGSIA